MFRAESRVGGFTAVIAPSAGGLQHDLKKKTSTHQVFVERSLRQRELNERIDKKVRNV